MNSASTQFVPSRRMGIYNDHPIIHQIIPIWELDFKENNNNNFFDTTSSPPIFLELDHHAKVLDNNQSDDTSSYGTIGASNKFDQEARRPGKVRRRLAQNREAARKSRLKKKAYVQQLENSKLKLIELEQELDRARTQGLYGGGLDTSQLGYSGPINSGIATFEMEYGNWVEEQNRQISDLSNALRNPDIGDAELCIDVDGAMNHYLDLFAMKATAARADVFYLMSGMWKTSAERFFSWIGDFRPSDLLKVLKPHLEPFSEQQELDMYNLKQSCQQAEDALSQGMEKLYQILSETIAVDLLSEVNYLAQIRAAMDMLEALVRFVGQADHLRQETLQQICRVLTTRQAARGLLALGQYLQRLRTLSTNLSSCAS